MTKRIDVAGDGEYWLDPDTLRLYDDETFPNVRVDLEKCTNPAEVLDVIMQEAGFEDPARTASIVKTLKLLLNPQDGLCSAGRPGEISKQEVRRRVGAALRQR